MARGQKPSNREVRKRKQANVAAKLNSPFGSRPKRTVNA